MHDMDIRLAKKALSITLVCHSRQMFLKGVTTEYHVILHRSFLLFGLHTSSSLFAFGMYTIYADCTFSSSRESKNFQFLNEKLFILLPSRLFAFDRKRFTKMLNKICNSFLVMIILYLLNCLI